MRAFWRVSFVAITGCAPPGGEVEVAPQPTEARPIEVEPTPPAGALVVAEEPPASARIPEAVDFGALRQAPPRPHQAQTAPVSTVTPPFTLRKKWATRVGKTTFRTTMALAKGHIVIGTHGDSLDGQNEKGDGVYLLEAATGTVVRTIAAPGAGDLDVGGIAIDGDTIFFTTDNGQLVAVGFDGRQRWAVKLQGKVRPAPALGDLDGNGVVDVVVGDEQGILAAFDGASGRKLWQVATGTNDYGARGFIGAAAIGDLDGDGRDDVVAGARDGVLAGYRGRDGKILWQTKHSSGIHASPSLADFDGDGQVEVLAAWSYSVVSVLDARSGEELWGQELALDSGGIEGLFGSPIPVPGAPGVIVQGTAWWDDEDGVVGVGAFDRAWKSHEGRVTASAVVGDLDNDGAYEAIVGTERGKLVWLRPDGGYAVLASLGGGIEAPAMLADVEGNGTFELLVASNDGTLTCFETGSTKKPFLSRFRGNDPKNRGDLGMVALGWKATSAVPKTGPQSAGGGIRIDYLVCCQALAEQATRMPSPQNRQFLEAASTCTSMAAKGEPRDAMQKAIRPLVGGARPQACQ
jgi:hypothetical protein